MSDSTFTTFAVLPTPTPVTNRDNETHTLVRWLKGKFDGRPPDP